MAGEKATGGVAAQKVEGALRQAVTELEGEKTELQREVAKLRRQVREQELALAAERQRVADVLDAARTGAAEQLERCESAAARPRPLGASEGGEQSCGMDELDCIEDESATLMSRQATPGEGPLEVPQRLSSHPEMSFWNVPLRRRAQTLCTLLFTWTTPLVLSSVLVVYILLTRNLWSMLGLALYVGWMFVLDDEAPRNGRSWSFVRRVRSLWWWKMMAEYYPLQLVKTADLPPEHNYMFCLHPHGVFSLSHAINFATDGTGFSRLFPGLKCFLVTLRQQFKVPFHREYLLSLGAIEVSREALLNTLSRGPGWSVAIVPGGAAEVLDAVNGTMRLTLLRRKGFVRVALRTGASLVPVVAFGENDLYIHARGVKCLLPIRVWQGFIKRCYGIASPMVMGRGVFNKKCPDPFMIPFRRPVTTVVGAPLALPRLPEPSARDVDYWHAMYLEKLKELWERSSATYAPGMQLELL